MKKSILQQKIFEKRKRIACARYILPFAATVLVFILLCIPCFYFTDYTNEITSNTSVIERMSSIWGSSRKAIFSSKTEATEQYIAFCQLAMTAIAISALCFIVALAVSLLYMISGLSQIYSENGSGKAKRIFLTFVPNEFVLYLLSALMLVPVLFPRAIVMLIERILVVYAKVTFVAGDIMIYGALLLLVPIVYSIVTKNHRIPELDVFADQKKADDGEDEEPEEDIPSDPSSPEARLYRMTKESKDEQAQKLRKLLGFDEDENE